MIAEEAKKLGWETWYNDNYWVHEKTISDPKSQDYTNYGMNLEDMEAYEKAGCPKFQAGLGFPHLSMLKGFGEILNK